MSSFIRIGQYVDLYHIVDNNRRTVHRYQNAFYGRIDDGYEYLGFIYQGAAKNRTGDNLEASLLLASNTLSTTLSSNLLTSRHYANVITKQFNEDDTVMRELSQEYWTVASMSYDAENVELILSSSIDAVGAQAPNKTLTRERVGNLPVTANIFVK